MKLGISQLKDIQMQTTPVAEIEHLLTPEEVSKTTKIPLATLATWRSNGRGQGLAFVRMGGVIRYRRADVVDFINSSVNRGVKPDHEALAVALHANPLISMLAAKCSQATLTLIQKSAQTRFVHEAVLQSENPGGTTAERYLRDKLAAIQGETDAFDAGAKSDLERRREESAKAQPLKMALMAFENGLISHRARLVIQIENVDVAQSDSIDAASRAGLSLAEMELIGRFEPPAVSVAKWRTQIAEIDGQRAQVAAYGADPLHDMKHLEGLPVPGFEQQLAAVVAA